MSKIEKVSVIEPAPEPTGTAEVYVATVRILIEVPGDVPEHTREGHAQDAVSEPLRDLFLDWAYVEFPTPTTITTPHHEGDFL